LIIEILGVQPISGEFTEFKFDASGDCTWVKFSSQNRVVVGIFGNGELTTSSVTLFDDGKHVLILASGQGYIIDLASMKLTHKTERSYLSHAKLVKDTQLVAASDFFSVLLYKPEGLVWVAERIANDDLKIDIATAKLISGTFWSGTEISKFTLDITSVVN
jgi:hypothetical protein